MAKITAIKQQVKRADRYSIYIDGKYTCSFSEGELLKLGLRIGQELSPDELTALKKNSQRDKAFMRAMDLISRRPRSRWELEDYLKRKEYAPELTEQILNMLSDRGYVNDLDFATRWVENRRLLKATSKRRLQQELRQKHVSSDIIDQVLAADETDEREILRELIERKRKQTKYQDNLKLMQYLSRQGYGYDDIKSAMSSED
jgi:regulatory protein